MNSFLPVLAQALALGLAGDLSLSASAHAGSCPPFGPSLPKDLSPCSQFLTLPSAGDLFPGASLALPNGLSLGSSLLGHEDFSHPPSFRGWAVHGDPTHFTWNEDLQRLEVTWDSTRPNAFFHRPLPFPLRATDSFRLSFRMGLEEVETPNPDQTFPICLGLVHRNEAFHPETFRGSGIHPQWGPRNLFEFSYFPASQSIAPTASAVLVGDRNTRWSMVNLFPFDWAPGAAYQVDLQHDGTTRTLSLEIRDGDTLIASGSTQIGSSFGEFHLDTLSLHSYSGDHQPSGYGGQVWARGWVDDLAWELPAPPISSLTYHPTAEGWTLSIPIAPGWTPVLEVSHSLPFWSPSSNTKPRFEGDAVWIFTPPVPAQDQGPVFYRVTWTRP